MVTIDSILDDIMKLDFESREVFLEILRKHQAEERRDRVVASAALSLNEYRSGKLKTMSAEEAIEYLNQLGHYPNLPVNK